MKNIKLSKEITALLLNASDFKVRIYRTRDFRGRRYVAYEVTRHGGGGAYCGAKSIKAARARALVNLRTAVRERDRGRRFAEIFEEEKRGAYKRAEVRLEKEMKR